MPLALALGLLALPIAFAKSSAGRTIVLGFDGMDPQLTERWITEGWLPHFAKLRDEGHYQLLETTNPAQSPVAWATFATGLNPGVHGIFDFVHRDAGTYGPKYSITDVEPPESALSAFGWRIPLSEGSTRSQRSGTAFWTTAEREGRKSSVLRVPVTYPADPITRMLSGMGVPDLLGTQGTFTIYTTAGATVVSGHEGTNARIVRVKSAEGHVGTRFEGPLHPLRENPEPLAVPLAIEDLGSKRVRVDLDGNAVELAESEWSEWLTLRFSFAGLMSVSGTVRLLLVEAFPDLRLYVSPIQMDPREPVGPIASPIGYAAELAGRIGLYHTIGMPEETWSLNEEQISDSSYLDMIRTTLAESEAMFFDTLERNESDLVVSVFVQTDRVSHMFWRGIDPEHPLHEKVDEQGRNAIRWIYGEADRILGRTLDRLGPEDRLIVLSDHGFSSFRRGVNLNRWLVKEGFMTLKPGQPTTDSLFANVDWPRTKAYAIGLNSLFLNLKDRESLGIVRPEQVETLKGEIKARLESLSDPRGGESVIAAVHDASAIYGPSRHATMPDLVVGYNGGYRASWSTALGGVPAALIEDNDRKWSGDHLIEPSLVPGVLFTSFKPGRNIVSIADVPLLIKDSLGLTGRADPGRTAPSKGWLDIASPVLSWIEDHLLFWLPNVLRIIIWGVLASLGSMAIYKWISNQARIAETKNKLQNTRSELNAFDGDLAELWPLLGRNLALAGRQLGLTFVPAMAASLPVIFILIWMSNIHDALTPRVGEEISVQAMVDDEHQLPPIRWQGGKAQEAGEQGVWQIAWPSDEQPMRLIDSDGMTLLTLPGEAPVQTTHQKRWWNVLVGNPSGYLPSPGDVDTVVIALPRAEFQPFGPWWLRSWITLFFGVIVIASLSLKFAWRLH